MIVFRGYVIGILIKSICKARTLDFEFRTNLSIDDNLCIIFLGTVMGQGSKSLLNKGIERG